jgi:NAD(P)-dependent dehydrogenase (short-subunit alcohol dehydrogenase family)
MSSIVGAGGGAGCATTSTAAAGVFRGKLALVTGGSGTIGRAIAAMLVRHGATVVLAARNLEKLQAAACSMEQECRVKSGAFVKCIPCDVSNESSVVALFETMDKTYPSKSLNLLINNAGINVVGATVDLPAADFERVLHVNVLGPFLCAREAMKRMSSSSSLSSSVGDTDRRIINIGSLSGSRPRPDSCPYTTSKFALMGLTHSLALDGRSHGISVGILHPGNVESDLLTEEMKRERRETEGFLSPEAVADCVYAMASMPPGANVLEMTLFPTQQPYVGRG